MKIVSVAYSVPSRRLSNDDIIDFLDGQNADVPYRKKAPYLKLAKKLLDHTGAQTRHLRDVEAGETAREHVVAAMEEAMEQAGVGADDIDLLIFCGVGRGFLEPANAYFFAATTGMHNANCFDVTDACMSWVRAMQIADQMLSAKAFRRAMIINGEFHLGIHDNWKIRKLTDLSFNFAMYTIGEAATATIVEDSEDEWRFSYSSRPKFVDLCTIPLPGYSDFSGENERIGVNGVNKFVSWAQELLDEGGQCLSELLLATVDDRSSKDIYFPHAPSERVYAEALPKHGIPLEKGYLEVYRNFGNLVSASIPTGMACALDEGRLKRGDEVALIPVSAGIVAAVVEFKF